MWKIFDLSSDEEERKFYILALCASIGDIFGSLANLILYGFSVPTKFCFVCTAFVLAFSLFGYFTKHIRVSAYLILAVFTLFQFPMLYYAYGNSVIPYMIIGILGVVIFMRKMERIFDAVGLIMYYIIVILYSDRFPSSFEKLTQEQLLGSTVCTFTIGAACTLFLIITYVTQHERESFELKHLTEELKEMSDRDPLTNVYNRRYLTNYLLKMLENENMKCVMVLLDLDDFKAINDRFGHVFGDKVLIKFSNILKKYIQDRGIVARFGGEEFMIVCESTTKAEIEELIQKIKHDYMVFSQAAQRETFTFSGGGDIFDSFEDITHMFNTVDRKLYKAKGDGKNKVIWDEEKAS